MNKRILLLMLILNVAARAQYMTKETIIQSGQYYYGEGIAQNYNEAKDYALKELTSQIAIHVAGSFERKVTEGCLIYLI